MSINTLTSTVVSGTDHGKSLSNPPDSPTQTPKPASSSSRRRLARKKAQAAHTPASPPLAAPALFDPLYKPAKPNVTFKPTWQKQYSHYDQAMEITHEPNEGGQAEVIALVEQACQFAFDHYNDSGYCKDFLRQVNTHKTSRVHILKGLHQFKGPDKCHFSLIIGEPNTGNACFHVNLVIQDHYLAKQQKNAEPLVGNDKWKIESLTS